MNTQDIAQNKLPYIDKCKTPGKDRKYTTVAE